MPKFVSPEVLLKGAVYNLEQCGLFVRDAALLYQNGSYPGAAISAALALEALGKWKTLLDLYRKVFGGEDVTMETVSGLLNDHERMQEAGNLSTSMIADNASGLGKLLNSWFSASPRSEAREKLDEEVDELTNTKAKRDPGARHKQRIAAQYVDLMPNGTWRRPIAVTSQGNAWTLLTEAYNNYAGQRDRYINIELHFKDDEPKLFKVLDEWTGRPELPNLPE
jgi:AbiV family abortive infection protein